jgi:hypothetical protein
MNVELRGLLRVWNEHWANYEYMGAASHVRAGWIYHDEGDLANGRDSRVARLSRNGTTDVLQEYSWLDNEIPSFLDPARFPRHVTHPNIPDPTPVAAPVQTPAGTADAPPVTTNPVNITMEPVDGEDEARPAAVSALIAQVERMNTNC